MARRFFGLFTLSSVASMNLAVKGAGSTVVNGLYLARPPTQIPVGFSRWHSECSAQIIINNDNNRMWWHYCRRCSHAPPTYDGSQRTCDEMGWESHNSWTFFVYFHHLIFSLLFSITYFTISFSFYLVQDMRWDGLGILQDVEAAVQPSVPLVETFRERELHILQQGWRTGERSQRREREAQRDAIVNVTITAQWKQRRALI